jgi:hypothetical protein
MTNETNKTFLVGETYATRSACNHDCIFRFTVIKRTAKFVTLDDGHSVERRGVYLDDYGVEHCKPNGTYSMCAIIDAHGSLVRPDGEITSEFENKNRISPEWRRINAEREAEGKAPVPPVAEAIAAEAAAEKVAVEAAIAAPPVRKPDPQLEGIGCKAEETPLTFASHSAEEVVSTLLAAGFPVETLRSLSPDRIVTEFEAITRRAAFSVVAA